MDITVKRLCKDIIDRLEPFNLKPDSRVIITGCHSVERVLTNDELSQSATELRGYLKGKGLPEHTARVINYPKGLVKVTVGRQAA